MPQNRISNIYQHFSQSHECFEKFKANKLDISWLENKLESQDILKLEESITAYYSQNFETMFECGFLHAWELFHQCEERIFQNE